MKKGFKIVFFSMMVLFVLGAYSLFAAGQKQGATGKEKYTIAMVVKLEGVAWFDNMRLGIQEFDRTHDDVYAYQIGADTADPAAQVALVNDLIAKGVDAILVIPNDPESLVPAFKKANEAGILTFTHEGSNQKQVSFDLEAFDNNAYGRHMMDVMAKWMNYEGEWAAFVGHLTSTTHNEWVDGEEQEAKEKYPKLKMVAPRFEEQENQKIAYEKSLELLKTYPNLKAIMGSAMTTVPGAARAIEEKGLIGKVGAFGTCLPSVAGDYLKNGSAISIHFWVPADAGYCLANVAYKVLKGEKITDGMNLGKPGYENIKIKKNKYGVPVIYGNAWVDVNKDNLKEWMTPDGKYKL